MELTFSRQGIYMQALDLWLDPQTSQGSAWVSHAHSDHARHYSSVLFGTDVTLEIYRMRWPEQSEKPQQFHPKRFGETWEYRGAKFTAYPAGHILGAAQLLIEFEGERFVYTGDLKLREPLCGLATQIVPCDHLVIESTFGLPVYHFLSREEAAERILQFARETLEDGAIPAFTGYALGRGQEIAHVLCQAGIPTAVHGAIAKYVPVYEQHGYAFPGWEPYEPRNLRGKALVTVPGLKRNLEARGLPVRQAYVSGWASVDNARLRSGAEMLIPYSDHADFQELLRLVEASGARRVDVVHGYAEAFARILRQRGIAAAAPNETAQRVTEEEVA
jgi:Cft2 family RNA processing exonuclease